jgi:hypothetical protein
LINPIFDCWAMVTGRLLKEFQNENNRECLVYSGSFAMGPCSAKRLAFAPQGRRDFMRFRVAVNLGYLQ